MEGIMVLTFILIIVKIWAIKTKFTIKRCGKVGHKTFTSRKFYWNLYKKKLPKPFLSVISCLLQHIQDLDNHLNATKRVFAPIFLE